MGPRTWVGLAAFIGMWATNFAIAADWSLVPSVTQRSEFNSNINLTFANPISDYMFTLTPAADFNYTTEISQLQGHLGLSGQHFITQSQLDHIDQNYQINGQYRVSPRVNLSLNSAYIVDTTLQQELLASGQVMSRTPRTSFLANPGATYNITESLLSTVSYNFNRVLYQSPQYVDHTDHQAGINFTYLYKNEKTTLISNNIVRETLYSGGNIFRSLGIYLGVTHKLSERWDVNLMSGANISFFSYNTQVVNFFQAPSFLRINTKTVKDSNVTPYINVSTSYRWNNLTMSADFRRDESPSGYGSIYEVNQLNGALKYQYTERLSGSLSGSYYMSTQSGQTLSSAYNYYTVGANLTYQFTEKLSVSPGYSYGGWESLTGAGGSTHAHIGGIQLAYSYPLHYQR